jgi:DNA recombination protein RmuC
MEIALIAAVVVMAGAVLALVVALLRSGQRGAPGDDRFDSLNRGLGEVKADTRRMLEVGEEMRQVLGTPTLRGGLGERMLEQLLGQVLPTSAYATQHQFRNGSRVDALVQLHEGQFVSVDAKFPMESYKRLVEADDAERDAHRRQLHRAVRGHVDDIADKYICPGETLDFALMYVPAENVYYEIVVNDDGQDDFLAYAWGKRVFPTSPNSLYAYLHVVATGLRGLEIERSSRETLAKLGQLERGLERFAEDYRVLGGHLRNAQSKYDDGWPKLQSVQRDWPGQLPGSPPAERLAPGEHADESSQPEVREDEEAEPSPPRSVESG